MAKVFTEQELVRLDKVKELRAAGINPYNNGYAPEVKASDIRADYEQFTKEELDEKLVVTSVAGRIMTNRNQGKAGFATLKDSTGDMQLYFNQANLTEEEFSVWKQLDLGDIVFAEGEIMKTGKGALSVRVKKFVLLTKAVRPLPEKFHGLTDIEERYRRRYVDLIMNDESREVFTKRSKMMMELRELLSELGYIEVETPILQTIAGGAAAKPFVTHHNTLDIEMFMRIAPELYLKRLIVGGYDKVFEIGRLFRNEGMSIKHNPEFTTMELYEAYGDMNSMMDITETIIQRLCLAVNDTLQITYGETEIDLSNFKKVRMSDLVNEVCGVNFDEITTYEEAVAAAKEHHVTLDDHHFGIGHILNEFFEQKCEETLIQPTMVYNHPVEVSPLSRIDDKDPRYTERFELFIDTREYANAFSELNDPIDQLERFENQVKEADLGNDEATRIDYDFVEALETGLPPTGGLGIGIDRLVMLLTNSESIRDVILFPTMKNK
ncbi:lysine--tRNA ligase [Mollicutes bacterium LVI A0039]|nr:lysine--tRNA ligase [Mollicutes bacterium LVI A0039]